MHLSVGTDLFLSGRGAVSGGGRKLLRLGLWLGGGLGCCLAGLGRCFDFALLRLLILLLLLRLGLRVCTRFSRHGESRWKEEKEEGEEQN